MTTYLVIKYYDLRNPKPKTIELVNGKATIHQTLAGDFDVEVLQMVGGEENK